MSLLGEIPLIGGMLSWAVPFLIVLSIVVFIHELGHYLVGRWCGIHADVFSVGFGREIWGREDSRGTRWRIAVLPLGGYVKFRGDSDAASARTDQAALDAMSDEERNSSFPTADLWRRTLTVLAGPVANFILSIVIYAGISMYQGTINEAPVIGSVSEQAPADLGLQVGDRIVSVNGLETSTYRDFNLATNFLTEATMDVELERNGEMMRLTVGNTRPSILTQTTIRSAARDAGVMPGDRIVAINGEPVAWFDQIRTIVKRDAPGEMAVEIDRDGEILKFNLTPRPDMRQTADGEFETVYLIGVAGLTYVGPEIVAAGPLLALQNGVQATYNIISGSLQLVGEMFAGKQEANQLSGPIGIATMSGDAAAEGGATLLRWIAVISASIGLLNLFPIPVLDGGHLVFYAIEALLGKPVGTRWVEIGTVVGLGLVLALMVFATYNDVGRLLGG